MRDERGEFLAVENAAHEIESALDRFTQLHGNLTPLLGRKTFEDFAGVLGFQAVEHQGGGAGIARRALA